ncbi:MAG TPA: oligosaccharide flippase family protein [Patescibacteria group bacterium]|jgi:O-antigen/teichoic acid export membrane protein|nr:oligosaccharide flippase family protein [Patescibacteria group bacterium]
MSFGISGFLPARLVQFASGRLQTGSLGRRLANAAVWSLAGALVARSMGIVGSVIVARLLGKEGFGQYGIVQSTVMMFGTLAGFGLGLTATRHLSQYRRKDPAKAGRILGLSTIMALGSGGIVTICLLAGAPWLAQHTLAAPQLTGPLRIGALLVLFTALNGAQTGALVGLEAFKLSAQLNLITGLVSLPLLVGGVVFFRLQGALWGAAAGAFITWLVFHWGLRRELARAGIPFAIKGSLQEMRVLWAFSLPAVISGMLAAPVIWACNALLVNGPNGYAEMGIANAANQWFYALLFLPGVLARSSISVLSERLSAGDKSACRKVLLYGVGLNAAVVIPLVLAGCVASPYIMSVYGPGFAQHSGVLIVSIVTGAVVAIQVPMGQTTAASGRMWTEICMNLGWALVFFGGTWLVISHGALGLMSARLVAYVFHTLWTLAFAVWLLRERKSSAQVP